MYNSMKSKIAKKNLFIQNLVKACINWKAKLNKQNRWWFLILNWFLFSKFSNAFDGKIRFLVCGKNQFIVNIYEFLSATITLNIVCEYGLI
jgi:long-subunit acyl-CoA synthetase (AMP-forming)